MRIELDPPLEHTSMSFDSIRVFLLVLWNPETMSLKITCEKMKDEKSENLREQWSIKFWIRLQKTVTEMKEMLDAA